MGVQVFSSHNGETGWKTNATKHVLVVFQGHLFSDNVSEFLQPASQTLSEFNNVVSGFPFIAGGLALLQRAAGKSFQASCSVKEVLSTNRVRENKLQSVLKVQWLLCSMKLLHSCLSCRQRLVLFRLFFRPTESTPGLCTVRKYNNFNQSMRDFPCHWWRDHAVLPERLGMGIFTSKDLSFVFLRDWVQKPVGPVPLRKTTPSGSEESGKLQSIFLSGNSGGGCLIREHWGAISKVACCDMRFWGGESFVTCLHSSLFGDYSLKIHQCNTFDWWFESINVNCACSCTNAVNCLFATFCSNSNPQVVNYWL